MAVYDNRDSQSGDHTSRDTAGRDIHHTGIRPEEIGPLVADLAEKLDVAGRERRADYAAREMRQLYLDRRLDKQDKLLGDTTQSIDALRRQHEQMEDELRETISRGQTRIWWTVMVFGFLLILILLMQRGGVL